MVDVNKPIENPELVSAIEAIQGNLSAETEATLFECLKGANFLLVLHDGLQHSEPGSDGKVTLTQGTTISFPMLSDANGQPMYFGFTDWPSLYAWNEKPNQHVLIVPFSQLTEMVLRKDSGCVGFVLNPSKHNFVIPAGIFVRIRGQVYPFTLNKDAQVLLSEPSDYPNELVAAVKAKLKTIKAVKRAWLLLMTKEGEQSYLIVLEHNGDHPAICQAVGVAAGSHLKSGMYIDIAKSDQTLGERAIKEKKPFYKRGLFG